MRNKLFLVLMFISTMAYSITYTSLGTGNWGTAGTWNNGVPVDANGNIATVKTGHVVTATNLVFNNQFTINVEASATLIINANPIGGDAIVVKNNLSFNIASGGQVIVNGNFIAKNNAILDVNGTLSIDGDLTAGNGSTLIGTGSVSVTGTVTGPPGFATDSQLPIELLYFIGHYQGNSVVLNWATASELNNDYFIIEYTTDALNWDVLTKISGNGNSNIEIKYQYIHNTKDSYYYRLSQVDYDGNSEVFNIVSVTSPYLNQNIKYDVYDINGRFIRRDNIENLPHGVFLIKNGSEFKKIIH